MLFDLRGRGRRNLVRVIYTGLALLIGVGLVGFGVGGGFGSGGLFSAASSNEGSNGASFAAQIKKYRSLTEKRPNDLAAWENLTKALLHEGGNEAYVTSEGDATAKGKVLYKEASQAWTSYLALNPKKTNAELAQLVFGIYGEAGLNEPAKAVEALQIVVAARPEDAAYFAQLAEYAYKAKNVRVGDLASEKAVSLAPSGERKRLKEELAEVKQYPNGGKPITTTTNGKIYSLKKGKNGSYEGTQIGTVPKSTTSTGATTTSTGATTTSTSTTSTGTTSTGKK